jgi:hypothetical protein
MARAGTTTFANNDAVALFDAAADGGACAVFAAHNAAASTGTLLVNIPSLHGAGVYFPVPPGASQVFRDGAHGIVLVNAKREADSNVIAYWGVAAEMDGVQGH